MDMFIHLFSVFCRVYTRIHVVGYKLYPLVAVYMYLVSATKLSTVCRPSVAGYKGTHYSLYNLQLLVDCDINELCRRESTSTRTGNLYLST